MSSSIAKKFNTCRDDKCLELFNKLIMKMIPYNKQLNDISYLFDADQINPKKFKEQHNKILRKMYKCKEVIQFNKCMLDNCYNSVIQNTIYLLANFRKYNIDPTPKLKEEQIKNINMCTNKSKNITISQYLKILYQLYKI